MMLFVANIGSTMAKLFAFVFTRIKILFCCQWKNKKKNVSIRKLSHTIDASKLTITKSSLKRTKDNQEVSEKSMKIILFVVCFRFHFKLIFSST